MWHQIKERINYLGVFRNKNLFPIQHWYTTTMDDKDKQLVSNFKGTGVIVNGSFSIVGPNSLNPGAVVGENNAPITVVSI